MSFPIVRTTVVRAPSLTPTTLIHVIRASCTTTVKASPAPRPAAGQKYARTRPKKTVRLATAATRASQLIQPTWKPTKLPNAARA